MRCVNPKVIWPHRSIEWCDANEEYSVSVPCGKCLACLSNKRSDWAFRLEQEFKYSKCASFVTLTYDEKHLRSNRSLCKRDVQLFLKRLRKKYVENRIRYYCVGEYGSKGGRPHYHLLLFNCEDTEAVRDSWRDSRGNTIGIVHVGTVTQASISYCLKYLVQPMVEVEGLEPPFALMSRGYAIGGRYLTDAMVQWHRDNDANFAMREHVRIRLPRFYRSKIWYDPVDKERVSKSSLLRSLQQQELERKVLISKFGPDWERKYREMQVAMFRTVKTKVSFSQTF